MRTLAHWRANVSHHEVPESAVQLVVTLVQGVEGSMLVRTAIGTDGASLRSTSIEAICKSLNNAGSICVTRDTGSSEQKNPEGQSG